MNLDNPQQYEQVNVHDVYHKIAQSFDKTRYKIWPSVQKFIDDCCDDKNDLKVLEVGCGNGKNLVYINENYPTVKVSGCDYCSEFVEMTRRKGIKDCVVANNLDLPYSDQEFDVVLSVAVIHHFTTESRRIQAIKELIRVLKPNGLLFVQVWAFEQPENSKRQFNSTDELVSWKKKNQDEDVYRYYHLFKNRELENLFSDIKDITILESSYDYGNWIIKSRKKKE